MWNNKHLLYSLLLDFQARGLKNITVATFKDKQFYSTDLLDQKTSSLVNAHLHPVMVYF